MTATLAAILIEKNFLTWKSTVSELLPGYALDNGFKKITLELLLSHRSGLHKDIDGMTNTDAINLFSVLEDGVLSAKKDRELVTKFILSQKPRYKSSIDYHYSNLGYIVVGHILEKITGSSWENLIKKYVFNPLGMQSCGFSETSVFSKKSPNNTWGHKLFNNKLYSIHGDNPEYFAPAGNIHCNLFDWSKYLSIHLNSYNGENSLISLDSFKKLHKLYPAEDSYYTYGGWIKTKQSWTNGFALVHGGTNTYNYARVWVLPGHNTILMATSNIGGTN